MSSDEDEPAPSPSAAVVARRASREAKSRALRSDHSSVQESLRALPCTRCAHSISRRSAALSAAVKQWSGRAPVQVRHACCAHRPANKSIRGSREGWATRL
eukprot:scaffold1987_cov71-Phaeocystis_antarctica.AAC.3